MDSDIQLRNYIIRGVAMRKVQHEAENLLREYADIIETSKPEIVSNLKEFALEEAGIKLSKVIVWDQGSIDIDFGPMVENSMAI